MFTFRANRPHDFHRSAGPAVYLGSTAGPSAFLINNRIVIDGPDGSSGITLSAAGTTVRFFDVAASGDLTLDHPTISGGNAIGFAGGNSANGPGGGSGGLGGARSSTRAR